VGSGRSCGRRRRASSDEAFIRLVRGRHKPDILIRQGKGCHRFAELRRAIPGLSERVLARQLDELERDDLIERRVYAEVLRGWSTV
jgi:DNA-binding HxlR family transcriptional regulator